MKEKEEIKVEIKNKGNKSEPLFNYDEAVAKLEILVERFESKDIPFDILIKDVKEANELIKKCRDELRTYEKDLLDSLDV